MESIRLTPSFFIYRSERFEDIYKVLIDQKNVFKNRLELFTFSAIVGFRKNRRSSIIKRATEMRTEQLAEKDLVPLFTIMFNESEKDFNKMNDYEYIKKKMEVVEEYAEGGMEYLCENLFYGLWNGVTLDSKYDDYQIDIVRFIYDESFQKDNSLII